MGAEEYKKKNYRLAANYYEESMSNFKNTFYKKMTIFFDQF